MTKKFDRVKVEAALKQAGKTALTGSRIERSGRFVSTGAAKQAPRTAAASALSQSNAKRK